MIHADEVVARNGRFELGPVTLDVGTGYVVLAGHNAAGKSTLMRCLVGLQRPVSGRVSILGRDPFARRERPAAMAAVGYCPQTAGLPSRPTVRQALHYAAWLKGLPAVARDQAVARALSELALDEVADQRIGRLSGGFARRVSIATAVVHDPHVLVLDEPTAGLDPVQRVSLRDRLLALAQRRTVIVSTHLVEDVEAAADIVLVLRRGRQVFTGTTAEVGELASLDARGNSPLERGLWELLSTAEEPA